MKEAIFLIIIVFSVLEAKCQLNVKKEVDQSNQLTYGISIPDGIKDGTELSDTLVVESLSDFSKVLISFPPEKLETSVYLFKSESCDNKGKPLVYVGGYKGPHIIDISNLSSGKYVLVYSIGNTSGCLRLIVS